MCEYSSTGSVSPAVEPSRYSCVPSRMFHPKLHRRLRSPARQPVDLLVLVLADVADHERAGVGVEAELPRVAQAVRPDLGPAAAVRERVVGRDRRAPRPRVGVGSMRSSLPSSVSSDWPLPPDACPAPWSSAAPPSPVPIQSMPSGPVTMLPPLWFGWGCAMREQLAPAAAVGGAVGLHRVRVDAGVAVLVRVVDVERRAVGGEGEAEQTALAAGRDRVARGRCTGVGSSAPLRMARTRPTCSVT